MRGRFVSACVLYENNLQNMENNQIFKRLKYSIKVFLTDLVLDVSITSLK